MLTLNWQGFLMILLMTILGVYHENIIMKTVDTKEKPYDGYTDRFSSPSSLLLPFSSLSPLSLHILSSPQYIYLILLLQLQVPILNIFNPINNNIKKVNQQQLINSIKMEHYDDYQPLKWPPLPQLAQLHLKCAGPGKDNIEGLQCPCCNRFQKIKTTRWWTRNINKDFKVYGGGIPAYFEMIRYYIVVFLFLSLLIVIFHIYILQRVCSDPNAKCIPLFKILKFCNSTTIYQILISQGENNLAYAFAYLQLATFVILIISTIGMTLWLKYINNKKIVKQSKVFSSYSLMIKNIPKYYQLQDVRKQIVEILPGVQICELFFVHQIAEFETKYKQLFDLYYEIKFTNESIVEQRGGSQEQLEQLTQKYVKLYQQVDGLKKKLYENNGRAIIVFNTVEQRQNAYQQLRINQFSKLIFHVGKLFGQNTRKLHFFADSIVEPQEINWKYIGESSVTKTKVRIQTTVIVLAFMIISFGLLFVPIYEVNEAKVQNPSVGTGLNILISLGLIVLSIAYRMYILKIMPRRHPSSRQSESYFIIINTVIFHFLFYVVAPGFYYIFASGIPPNPKLAQLFFAVVLFIIMNVIVACIDIRYRIFRGRRQKLMKSWSKWGKYCQIRLHQELKYPSFPIEFKIMVILNIWSFNAFYIFQIPYLLVLFWLALVILYWVDKKNIYSHYKMQVYLSIQMQLSVQRDYVIFFLICVSCGYAITAVYDWQYYFIIGAFVVALGVSYFISIQKKGNSLGMQKSMTLAEMIRTQTQNPKQSMIHQIMETQNRDNIMILDESFSSKSLGSVTFHYGYHEQYESYLNQFKNKNVNVVMQKAYEQFLRTQSNIKSSEINSIRKGSHQVEIPDLRNSTCSQQPREENNLVN